MHMKELLVFIVLYTLYMCNMASHSSQAAHCLSLLLQVISSQSRSLFWRPPAGATGDLVGGPSWGPPKRFV